MTDLLSKPQAALSEARLPLGKRILVIPLRFIGDSVVTIPLIRNIRYQAPQARIEVLASATTAPLFETCPYVDRVWVEPKGKMNLLKQLQQEAQEWGRYDTAFLLRKSVTMAGLLKLSQSVGRLIGYDKQRFFQPLHYKRWGLFLDRVARYPTLKTTVPQSVSHLSLLQAAGYPILDQQLELWPTETDQTRCRQLLHQLDPTLETAFMHEERCFAAIHLSSASHGKTVELDKFIPSLQALQQAGFPILATGVEVDTALYDALAERAAVPLVNLAGKTTLRETAALYQKTKVLLTLDSGPIHLASAMAVPEIVGVFGPTNQLQWGPYGKDIHFQPIFVDLPCRPCYAKVCSHNQCKTLLSPEQIKAAVVGAVKVAGNVQDAVQKGSDQ